MNPNAAFTIRTIPSTGEPAAMSGRLLTAEQVAELLKRASHLGLSGGAGGQFAFRSLWSVPSFRSDRDVDRWIPGMDSEAVALGVAGHSAER